VYIFLFFRVTNITKKGIKKWSLYLEDFEVNDTDPSDIKMAKEKLNTLRKQIDEFNIKSKEIDIAYKTNDDKKISDMEKKLFGDADIKSGADRNEFLVKYLNIAKKKREIEKNTNNIASDNANLIKSKDIMNVTTDSEIKNRYNKSVIPNIQKNIDSSKNKIKNNEKDINLQITQIQKEMSDRQKELMEYIQKIQNQNKK
jgi:hypothetical protein